MRHYKLKISVFSTRDGKETRIGTGFIGANEIFPERLFEGWIDLHTENFDTDDDINNLEKSIQLETKKEIGRIRIFARLIPRLKLEEKLFETVVSEFDSDYDGRLSKYEAFELFSSLQPNSPFFEKFFNSLDYNHDSYISNDEIIRFLGSSEFQSSPFMNMIISSSLSGRIGATSCHLMRGCTYSPDPNSQTIKVMDRNSGLQINENIPTYIKLALRAMTTSVGNRIMILCASLLEQISKRQGRKYDNPKSRSEIPHFIALHNINTSELEKPVEKFDCFNDFFARSIRPECRPVAYPHEPSVCISPADCRLTVFNDIHEAKKIWIKGQNFTLNKLLQSTDVADKYRGGSLAICRLAPQDYHR